MNIEELRAACLGLPGTAEEVKWGNELCFLAGNKIYCMTGMEPPFRASFKVTETDFNELTSREGIVPAPYLARNKWIQVQREGSLNHREWLFYVRRSYEIVISRLPGRVRHGILSSKPGKALKP